MKKNVFLASFYENISKTAEIILTKKNERRTMSFWSTKSPNDEISYMHTEGWTAIGIRCTLSLELLYNSLDNGPSSIVFYLEMKVEVEVGVLDIRSHFTPRCTLYDLMKMTHYGKLIVTQRGGGGKNTFKINVIFLIK